MLHKLKEDIISLNKNIPKSNLAVFLDRDGVINEEVHLLHKISDLKLIKSSAKAIKTLNEMNIPVFMVSNQTVLARGIISKLDFNKIHSKLVTLLKEKGARLDGYIYCVHSEKADKLTYRKKCSFRKPDSGMITEIEKRLKIKYKTKIIIGDQARDILMANKAKGIGILVKTGHAGKDFVYTAQPDIEVNTLYDAVSVVKQIVKNNNTSALILAGGKGSRLKDLTFEHQKVMLNIGSRPILSWQLQSLAKSGITNSVITLCYKPDEIINYLENKYSGLNVNVWVENEAKGTAGSLRDVDKLLLENFFVIYGDVLNNIDLSDVLDSHINNKAWCTLVVRTTDHPKDSDLVVFKKNNKVTEIITKPHSYLKGYGNTGIMLFNRKVLEHLPQNDSLDFIKDIAPICLMNNRLFVYRATNQYIKDIGTLERYQQAQDDFMKGKINYV